MRASIPPRTFSIMRLFGGGSGSRVDIHFVAPFAQAFEGSITDVGGGKDAELLWHESHPMFSLRISPNAPHMQSAGKSGWRALAHTLRKRGCDKPLSSRPPRRGIGPACRAAHGRHRRAGPQAVLQPPPPARSLGRRICLHLAARLIKVAARSDDPSPPGDCAALSELAAPGPLLGWE